MPRKIDRPAVIEAAGFPPKRIEEYAGRVNSGHAAVSVARMVSPQGWSEPGQRPEFEEITVVLRGTLRVEHEGGGVEIGAGEAVVTAPGEWVRYGSPHPGGAEYVAVCLPAFSPATVHRDDEAGAGATGAERGATQVAARAARIAAATGAAPDAATLPPGLRIDRLSIAEASAVLAAVNALLMELGEEGDEAGVTDVEAVLAAWRAAGDRFQAFAAREPDGAVAGLLTLFESFAIYAGGAYGVINEMYVAPGRRSAGVGAALIEAAAAYGRGRGWSRLDVTAPESPRWLRTRRFYESRGFRFTGPKLKRYLD
jgi:GNAT superfamily N-acetyltransferase/mannose-6-phosphate isomerase-like protein (cupin superfamily)